MAVSLSSLLGSDFIGDTGYSGSQGAIGYTGSVGSLGYTGSIGTAGQDGLNGSPIGGIIPVSVSRTLILTDSNSMLFSTASTTVTYTIPNDTTLDFPIGTVVHFTRDGTGSVTIGSEAGVTVRIRNGLTNQLAVQYSMATAAKLAANTWYLYGDLA